MEADLTAKWKLYFLTEANKGNEESKDETTLVDRHKRRGAEIFHEVEFLNRGRENGRIGAQQGMKEQPRINADERSL